MIKPIQNSISFNGNNVFADFIKTTDKASNPVEAVKQSTNETPKVEPKQAVAQETNDVVEINGQDSAPKEKASLKTRILNVVKGYNTLTTTASGTARGLAEATVAAGMVGFVGRNINNAKGQIGKTIVGMFKDTGKIIAKSVGFIPKLLTKSPIENLKSLVGLPKFFYDKCLKGNKITAAVAVLTFAAIAGFRVIQGKMIANKKNAEVDHYTKTKH